MALPPNERVWVSANDIHNISDGRIIVNSYRINDYLPLTIINN